MEKASSGSLRDCKRNDNKEKQCEINLKIDNLDEVQIKYHGKTVPLSRVLQEREQCEGSYELQRISREYIKRVREQVSVLENKKYRHDYLSQKLNEREERVERKRRKLQEEKIKREKEGLEKVDEINEQLQEEREEKNYLMTLCQQLVTKERQSNDELQEARKVLIEGLSRLPSNSHVHIGIRRMGEIDFEALRDACLAKSSFSLSSEEVEMKAAELCSSWQEKFKNHEWHPFNVVVDENGKAKGILKEDDELLLGLKEEWGDDVHNAITTALWELNDCNPSGRYTVNELWNFKEN